MAEVQSEARFIVALHIRSDWSRFAYVDTCRPDVRKFIIPAKSRLSAIYYEPGDAATARVRSWGYQAPTEYEQPSPMSEVGTYFGSFDIARESSTGLLQKGFTLTQVISDYLRLMGAKIMVKLRNRFHVYVSKNDVEWCVTLAHDWGDHAMKLMRTSMERAGLVQSAISSGGSPYPLRFVPELDAASYHCLLPPGGSHIQVCGKLLVADLGYKSCRITVQEVYSVERSKFEVKQVAESVWVLDGRKQFVEMLIEVLVAKMLPVQNALKVYVFKQFLQSHLMDPGGGPLFNIFGGSETGYNIALSINVQNGWKQLDVEHGNPIRDSYDVIKVTHAEYDGAIKPYYDKVVDLIAPQLLSTPNIKGILLVGEMCNFVNFNEKISNLLNSSVEVVTCAISVASEGAVAMVRDQVLPFTWKGGWKISKDGATASSSHGC